jgi:hypothetical protein
MFGQRLKFTAGEAQKIAMERAERVLASRRAKMSPLHQAVGLLFDTPH